MKFTLLYHPRSLKRLKNIPRVDQSRILKKLQELSFNPSNKQLDIKKLAKTRKSYRLRVGDLRAIYEVNEKEKIIYVWEIDYRGQIY